VKKYGGAGMLSRLKDLRWKLYETVEARGSLTHPDVLAVSREADRLVVILQRVRLKKAARPSRRARSGASSSAAQLAEELR